MLKALSVNMKRLVWLTPQEFCWRVLVSLMPPISINFKKIFVDLVGPIIAVVILTFILNFGNLKHKSVHVLLPVQTIILYIVVMPVICYLLNKIGKSKLTFMEVFSIITYALYGHILTLLTSLLFYLESSNAFFFICMTIFAGLSTFRLVLLQIQSIPLPGARLIVCSFSSTVHILFLMFIHFTYMHPTFKYGKKSK